MIDDDASSREATGTSMRTWLYLGAAALALVLVGLRDHIADESPPAVDELQQFDPGSARHAAGAPEPEATDVKLLGRGAQH